MSLFPEKVRKLSCFLTFKWYVYNIERKGVKLNKLRGNRFRKSSTSAYKIRNADATRNIRLLDQKRPKSVLIYYLKSILSFFYSICLFLIYIAVFIILEVTCENTFVYAFSQNTFIVQTIEVNQNVFYSDKDIVVKVKDQINNDMIRCDIAKIKQELLKLDNVADVEVKKIFPSKLVINLAERMPLFRMIIGGELIDKDGKEVKIENGSFKYNHLPVLQGFSLTSFGWISKEDVKRFAFARDIVLEFIKNESFESFEITKISSKSDWCDLYLNDEIRVRFPYEKYDDSLGKLKVCLNHMRKQGKFAKFVDLRFFNIIVKF